MLAYYAHSSYGDTIVIPALKLALEVNSDFFRDFVSSRVDFQNWRGPYSSRRCDEPESYGEIIAIRDDLADVPEIFNPEAWRTRMHFYLGNAPMMQVLG